MQTNFWIPSLTYRLLEIREQGINYFKCFYEQSSIGLENFYMDCVSFVLMIFL